MRRKSVFVWRRMVLSVLVLVLALVGSTPTGIAAEPPESPWRVLDKAVTDVRQVRQLRQGVNGILRSPGAPNQAQQETLKNYYGRTIFRAMTQPTALEDPNRFPAWRFEIVRDLNVLRDNAPTHDFVRKLVFDSARVLAAENPDANFRPACRYNALLILGELNETETRRIGLQTVPATPYAPARPILLKVLTSKQSDELQIAALIGLQRHAKLLTLAGSGDGAMVRAMVDIIRTEQPAADSSLDALHWKQRLCVETLGLIGQEGAAQFLEPVVLNENLPLSLRSAAAKALGQLDYRDPTKVNAGALLKGLGQVALAACRDEMQRMNDYKAKQPADQPAIAPGGLTGEGTAAAPEEDPVIRLSRRNLKYHLLCVKQGLQGVERVATAAEQKNTVTAMRAEVESILTGLDDNPASMTPSDLLNKIGPRAARLEQVVAAAN